MKRNTAFTLIEILVVVSIIALLASLLMPALRGAKHLAMEAGCRSQLHQVSTAIGLYMVDHQTHEPWRFNGDSVDAAHESSRNRQPGNPARALTANPATGAGPTFLPDGRPFFCPLVPITYDEHFERSPPYDYVTYWGTYTWYYRKVRFADDPQASPNPQADRVPYHSRIYYSNDISADLLMMDTRAVIWSDRGFGTVPSEHYNALMLGGDVRMVSRDWNYMNWWLWGDEGRPYPP